MYERPTTDRLERMLKMQRKFQVMIGVEKGGGDPAEKCSPDYLRDMKDALESELDELQNETGWKPWATSRHVNLDAARGEWIDAWHFMMNIALALGMDAEMIENMYFKKLKKNIARHDEGYDGVSTKCPICKRALDDEAVKCTRPIERSEGFADPGWCTVQGNTYFIVDGEVQLLT